MDKIPPLTGKKCSDGVSKPISYLDIATALPLIPDYGDPRDPAVRAKYAYLQSGICLIGNAFLLSAKLILSIIWGSVAVLGDALNHTADVAVSISIILAFRWSKKEADEEHPHGHGRIEDVLAIVVASMVVFMGVLIIREAVGKFANPTIEGSILFSGLMVIFAFIKALMATLSFAVAKRIDSDAIRGDAWNHTTDVLISLSLAAAIFVTTLSAGYEILDPIFGVIVAFIVMYAGGSLIRESSSALIGEAPPEEDVRKVREAAMAVKGVMDAHEIVIHDYGSCKIASLHVVVEETILVEEAHRIATEVEEKVKKDARCEATAHVEVTEPALDKKQIADIVRAIVTTHKTVRECTSVSVFPHPGGGDILLTLGVDGELSVRETDRILREVEGDVRVHLPHYRPIARAVPYGGGPKTPVRQVP